METLNILQVDEMLARGISPTASLTYQERVLNGNLTVAEAFSQIQDSNIEKLRTFISRGAANEATDILSIIQKEEVSQQEYLFEKCRLHCYTGRFKEASFEIESLLKQNLNPLTKMTAHQIAALCYYEQGFYNEALSEIDRVVGFEQLYPRAEASLFARSLRIRSLVKLNSIGLAQAETSKLWNMIVAEQYGLNKYFQLIMYLRALCELNKAQEKCSLSVNIAGMWLARKFNSPIHEGVFISNLAKSNNRQVADLAKKDLESFLGRFEGVKYYSQKEESPNFDGQIRLSFYEKSLSKIVFVLEKKSFSVAEGIMQTLKLTDQNISLLKKINNYHVDKADIYNSLWGSKEFHLDLHDPAIRTALKRLRGATHAEVVTEDFQIYLKDTLTII